MSIHIIEGLRKAECPVGGKRRYRKEVCKKKKDRAVISFSGKEECRSTRIMTQLDISRNKRINGRRLWPTLFSSLPSNYAKTIAVKRSTLNQ